MVATSTLAILIGGVALVSGVEDVGIAFLAVGGLFAVLAIGIQEVGERAFGEVQS